LPCPAAFFPYGFRQEWSRAEEHQVAGKFEVYKDAAGKFRFRLKASNGQVIATGEAYESKASALNGIESVRKNAADAALDDQTN